MVYFKSIDVCCPKCESHSISLNATKERELIFLNIGNQTCLIQQFKCKKCGANIPTDLSSIVKPNTNITYPVIDHVIHLYSFFHGSIRKIHKSLKKEHNIKISYQSIENILLFSDFNFENEDDIKDNIRSEKEINEINFFKSMIYEIIDVNDIEIANKLKFELIRRNDILPEVIFEILWDLLIPYFENLTYHHYDGDIESTSNKLENCFHHNFGKAIKKLYKSEDGILKRFDRRLLNWDDENKNW